MLETLFNPIYTTDFTFTSYIICTVTSLVLRFIIAISSGFKSRQSRSFLLSLFFLPAIVQQPVIMLVNGSAGTGCIQRQQRQVAYHKRRLCSCRRFERRTVNDNDRYNCAERRYNVYTLRQQFKCYRIF